MRRIVGLVLALALVAGFSACAKAEQAALPPAGTELVVVFATDLHHLAPALYAQHPDFAAALAGGDGKVTHYSGEIIRAFVAEVVALLPDAVVLGGDLTFNGEAESHRELADMLQPLAAAGIPVLVVPGNHDLNQLDAYRFTAGGAEPVEALDDAAFWALYAPLGAGAAAVRDTASLSYMFPLAEDVRLLLLDTAIYKNGRVREIGRVRDETLAWAGQLLAQAAEEGARVVGVSHHNLVQHSPLFGDYTVQYAARAQGVLQGGGIRLNLSGHMHTQHIAQEEGMYDIAASALSVSPHQYGVLRIDAQRTARYETLQVDVAAWAAAEGLADENLLDFAAYSAAYFDGGSAASIQRSLAAGDLTDAQYTAMYDMALAANAAYFAGAPVAVDPDAQALWEQLRPGEFFTHYLRYMVADGLDYRQLEVALG